MRNYTIVAFYPDGTLGGDAAQPSLQQIAFYPALAETLSAAYQDYSFDPEQLQRQDALLTPAYVCQRSALVQEGKPVAFAEYRHTPEMYHPRKFLVHVVVHPDAQGQGLGNVLYAHILAELEAYQPISLRAVCRADNRWSVAFLEQRGFVCGMSILELKAALLEPNTETARVQLSPKLNMQTATLPDHSLRGTGINLLTLDALASDTERDWKLYQLIQAIRADMPSPKRVTQVTFTYFVESFLNSPVRLSDATFVAVRAQCRAYVGFTDLFADGDGGLYCGLTGVHRDYRRLGIATALKCASIRYGCEQGYSCLKTFNAADNAAILAVNRQVGFEERCAWLHFEKLC